MKNQWILTLTANGRLTSRVVSLPLIDKKACTGRSLEQRRWGQVSRARSNRCIALPAWPKTGPDPVLPFQSSPRRGETRLHTPFFRMALASPPTAAISGFLTSSSLFPMLVPISGSLSSQPIGALGSALSELPHRERLFKVDRGGCGFRRRRLS